MSVNINLNVSYPARQVEAQVGALSQAIQNNIPFAVVDNCLVAKEGQNPHSLEVLYGLRQFLMHCANVYVHGHIASKPQIHIIHELCATIILKNPPPDDKRFGCLPFDLQRTIRTFLPPKKTITTNRVCKKWHADTARVIISYINAGHSFRSILPKIDYWQIGRWGWGNQLQFANLEKMVLDVDSLETFAVSHTNLCSLNVAGTQITEECLTGLSHLSHLTALDIGNNRSLQSLKSLTHVPKLRSLKLDGVKLSPNSLSHLSCISLLQELSLGGCSGLQFDDLSFLQHVPLLLKLNLRKSPVAGEALKNLKCVTKLQILNLSGCTRLEIGALNNLQNTPDLRSLDISFDFQLHPDSFSYLRYVTRLESLEIYQCTQLNPLSLKEFRHIPHLIRFDMRLICHFDPDCLSNLIHTPKLAYLNLLFCKNLNREVVPENLHFLINDV